MLKEFTELAAAAKEHGWIMEPEAKGFFSRAGLSVPKFAWAKTIEESCNAAAKIGYPVVAKVVSPDIIHKTEEGGVEVGITDEDELARVFARFSKVANFAGVLIEEMVKGVELIIGASHDMQFGPIILFGIGGTGVEIYRDSMIGMAPLAENDVEAMLNGLQGHQLLEGYRGVLPVNRGRLKEMLLHFSRLVVELGDRIESIDLNPVFANAERCVIGDARIMLR